MINPFPYKPGDLASSFDIALTYRLVSKNNGEELWAARKEGMYIFARESKEQCDMGFNRLKVISFFQVIKGEMNNGNIF